MHIDLPKLRGIVLDVRIGNLTDPEKIGAEIQIWEAVRSWAICCLALMDLVNRLGDRIDRDSYFATDIIGTETLDKWLADPAGLRVEREKLIADLGEMNKLIAAIEKEDSKTFSLLCLIMLSYSG